jgi:hypothetical protein
MKVLFSVAGFVALASASSFVAYSGGSYSGNSIEYRSCGCSNIAYHGSYKWYHAGQSGRMFNSDNCQGVAVFTLSSARDTKQPTGFGWRSIDIIC